MRRATRVLIGAGAVLALLAGAADPAAARPPTPHAPELQAALDAIRDAGMVGAMAEVRDGRRTWRGATGLADVDTGRPMRPEFQHRVGSITKTFTATVILQLVGEGRLYNMSWAWTAGALVSTTHDLNRFYSALLGGQLLRPAQLTQLKTTVPTVPGQQEGGYGLGIAGGRLDFYGPPDHPVDQLREAFWPKVLCDRLEGTGRAAGSAPRTFMPDHAARTGSAARF